MLKRKISGQLAEWKARDGHMSLIVEGARQIGKTYSISRFAQENYGNVIHIDFEESPRLKTVFADSRASKDILANIRIQMPGTSIVPGDTLLFLDEIQACPDARVALKYLSMDPTIDVIASGSLLGIRQGEVTSFPMGYVEHLRMHSLDFEEFLWARGVDSDIIDMLKERYFVQQNEVPSGVNESMRQRLHEYAVVGGMPQAVNEFLSSQDHQQVLRVQSDILMEYRNDIAKYAIGVEKTKAAACFDSIPNQLARDHKRFSYGMVRKGSGRRELGGSLEWLYEAGIINFCHALEAPELPFEGNADNNLFKVYMRDTGLLAAMLEPSAQLSLLQGDLSTYKGAVYENLVGDILAKNGHRLYYYEKSSGLEMDFFIREGEQPVAVEVKASRNRKAQSMRSLIRNHHVPKGYKLADGGNIGHSEDGKVTTLPLWTAMFL